MGRKRKYRAWTGKEMLYNVLYVNDKAVITDMQGLPNIANVKYRYGIKSIMEFTGLTDTNNIEIYEGDILKCHQFLFDGNEVEKEWIASVFYSADDSFSGGGIAGFCLKIISGDFYFEHTSEEKGSSNTWLPMSHIYGLHEESFEVIGNIYEHSGLLISNFKNDTK